MEKLILTLLVALTTTSASADTLLLRGATVHTVANGTLSTGDVLIRDGKIAQVGEKIEAQADRTVDLKGLHLFPGLISASTDLGLVEVAGVRASVDDRETGEFTPEVESWLAVNPDSEMIPVARANGIIHFAPTPQGKHVTGTSALLATRGWTIEDMLVQRRSAMHLVWPDHALSIPKPDASPTAKSLDEQARERREKVRGIEQFFADAEAWSKRPANSAPVPAWEAMQPVLKGEVPLMIHAQGLREIRAALKWSESHPKLRITLVGGRDAWQLADELAKRKIAVIYSEVFTLPARSSDAYDVQFSAPAVLHKAGVTVAISEGLERASASGQRNLPYIAAQAAAFGLPADAALAAITLVPAQLHGAADRLGSIEAGKDASLFAATGDILDIRSEVKHLWIGGIEQSLETKHTRLAEKYRARPKVK
ncbi:amidohydrolase family protein [Prosthecobacter sp.]|uniref:amidohydrolase family protein n=1 Tax=Prosthecobacter sp. TaxID=1965333 RepID=UPI002ABA807F|nr:amidohydrolase family protein [Prosthecobacter sp.]MDZ4402718.1 amidohydrolase family protein [Prosthecobacter sp.]